MFISKDLYKKGLIEPAEAGCNKLKIVSGYSTSAMAFKHINDLNAINPGIKVELIVGMTVFDGISQGNHRGFVKLVEDDFRGKFSCSYIYKNKPIHSKIYMWFKDDVFHSSYVGSANYTQNAFLGNNREVLSFCSDSNTIAYWESIERDSIYCDNIESEHLIQIYREARYRNNISREQEAESQGVIFGEEKRNLEHVKVSFLARDGSLPAISGLNWGQRDGRERNQAYIPLKSDVYTSNFFPPVTIQFTINTDDNRTLIATRAQQNGKAIHTPQNNSLLGEYFRMRLGLPNGAFINKDDLIRYGRTDIDFYKIDDETYYMDFSV